MLQFEKAREFVMSDVFWKDLDTAYRTLEPAYTALRYSDGMAGSSLALLYDKLLDLDAIYNAPIEGLDEDIRKQVSQTLIRSHKSTNCGCLERAFSRASQYPFFPPRCSCCGKTGGMLFMRLFTLLLGARAKWGCLRYAHLTRTLKMARGS